MFNNNFIVNFPKSVTATERRKTAYIFEVTTEIWRHTFFDSRRKQEEGVPLQGLLGWRAQAA